MESIYEALILFRHLGQLVRAQGFVGPEVPNIAVRLLGRSDDVCGHLCSRGRPNPHLSMASLGVVQEPSQGHWGQLQATWDHSRQFYVSYVSGGESGYGVFQGVPGTRSRNRWHGWTRLAELN